MSKLGTTGRRSSIVLLGATRTNHPELRAGEVLLELEVLVGGDEDFKGAL